MNFDDPPPPELSDCEELNRYLTRDTAAPIIPSLGEMARMPDSVLEALNERRVIWFERDLTFETPVVAELLRKARIALRSNWRKPVGRKGVIVSGEATTGKTTADLCLMETVHAQFRLDCPDTWRDATPVAYVTVPPGSTRRALMLRLASFYRIEADKRTNADELWALVRVAMRAHRTVLVVVDELQNLTIDKDGEISVDTLKDLANSSAATFVYVGMNVSRTKMLAGDRGRQVAGRVAGIRVIPYAEGTDAGRAAWRELVEGFAKALPLVANDPEKLVAESNWLLATTHGYIGSLAWMLSQAVDDLVAADDPAKETIDRGVLENVVLSEAAQPELVTGENPVELVLG